MSDNIKIMDTVLNSDQFNALHDTDPGSPAATEVLEDIGAIGLAHEVALTYVEDQQGNRTARYVALSLSGQGDVLSSDTATGMGLPTASQAARQKSAQQAAVLAEHDPATALRRITYRPGQAGSR